MDFVNARRRWRPRLAPGCPGVGYSLDESIHRKPALIGTERDVQPLHELRVFPENPDDTIFNLSIDKPFSTRIGMAAQSINAGL